MKRILPWVMSVLLALVCVNIGQGTALAAEAGSGDLVVNGSFEEPVSATSFNQYLLISGWELKDGPSFEVSKGIAGKAYDGKQLVEMDSSAVSGIYQDVPTEAGKTYTLSFAFSARPGVSDNKLNVSWGDSTVVQLSKSGVGLSNTDWQVYNYTVQATDTSTRLSFDNLNETSDGVGSYIDAVSVQLKEPQYASSVIGFSTEYSASPAANYSAHSILGKPDGYSWCAKTVNGGSEFLTLGFDRPVTASGITVTEAGTKGFITQVDVLDTNDTLHTVWQGTDPVAGNDSVISWTPTSFVVKGVKIYANTTPGGWEYIDAVELL